MISLSNLLLNLEHTTWSPRGYRVGATPRTIARTREVEKRQASDCDEPSNAVRYDPSLSRPGQQITHIHDRTISGVASESSDAHLDGFDFLPPMNLAKDRYIIRQEWPDEG